MLRISRRTFTRRKARRGAGGAKTATRVQLARRDVFVLNNGRKALLRKLQEGQVVRVLSVTETAGRTKLAVWEEAKNLNPEWAKGKDSDASVSRRR